MRRQKVSHYLELTKHIKSSKWPSQFLCCSFLPSVSKLLKKTKFHATQIPAKILNHVSGRPKMFCIKAKEKYADGLKDKAVYEEINKKSGETYYSSSKRGELGDTRKITGKKKRRKRAKERAHRDFRENSQRG